MRLLPRRTPEEEARGRSALVALAVHLVAVTVLVRVVLSPFVGPALFGTRGERVVVERIGFLQLPRADRPAREPARAGGDDRPLRAETAPTAPAPAAPASIPTALPPVPARTPAPDAGGTGPLVGGGGPVRGIQPAFTDPRLWAPQSPVVVAPRTPQEQSDYIDSTIARRVQQVVDSVKLANGGRLPGDWTFTKNGKKYGVDQQYIRLGNFSIPTALLGMLPLNNVQANPGLVERNRRLASMTYEIQAQAARALRDDEFRAAVKAIRERKDRERREQADAARAQAEAAAAPPAKRP